MNSIRKITLLVSLCISGQALLTPTQAQADNQENIAAVAAVAVAGLTTARTVYNRYKIWSIGQNTNPTNPMVNTEIEQENTKFYNWQLQSYPTAGAIAHSKNVAMHLQKDILSNKLTLERGVNGQINRQTILNAIAAEKTELSNLLKELEHFVKHFTWINIGPIEKGFGFHRAFEHVCSQVGIRCNPSEWNARQENRIEEKMKIHCNTGLAHLLLLKPNYGAAARVYWKTFKRLKRLEAIETIVKTENPNDNNPWPPIIIRDERRR